MADVLGLGSIFSGSFDAYAFMGSRIDRLRGKQIYVVNPASEGAGVVARSAGSVLRTDTTYFSSGPLTEDPAPRPFAVNGQPITASSVTTFLGTSDNDCNDFQDFSGAYSFGLSQSSSGARLLTVTTALPCSDLVSNTGLNIYITCGAEYQPK